MKCGICSRTLGATWLPAMLVLIAGNAFGDPPVFVKPTLETPAYIQGPSTTAPTPPAINSPVIKSPVIHREGAAITVPSEDYVQVPELSGEPETITERHPNGKAKIRREVVQDAARNYINHGHWKMWDEREKLQAEGTYRNGQRHGLWRRAYSRQGMFAQTPFRLFQGPYISEATFQGGKLDGVWTIQDRQGRKITQWGYKNGLRDGPWTWYFPNGVRMQSMTYDEGVLDGDFVQWNNTGKVVRRNAYQDGRLIEQKVERYPGERKKEFEVTYLGARLTLSDEDDWWNVEPARFQSEGRRVKHGPATYWHRNGQKQTHGYYEHGIAQGEFTWWRANGQKLAQGNYRNGQPHGMWMWWRENGVKKLEGRFHEGTAVGAWAAWSPRGEFVKELDAQSVQIFINTQTPHQPPSADTQEDPTNINAPAIPAPPPSMDEIDGSSSASRQKSVNVSEILNR